MKVHKHKNRYGDEFIFTPDKDNNILWEGDFKYCRFGLPNDYTVAYETYLKDRSHEKHYNLEQFIEKVHDYDFNNKTWHWIGRDYRHLVKSDESKFAFIDPSGGPYIQLNQKSENIHSDIKGKTVVNFEKIDTGYKIILE